MRVLFLTHRLPYAPNRGDRIRAFHLLRILGQAADVHLVSLVHDEEEAAQQDALAPLTASVSVARVPRLRNLAGAALALPGTRPLTHVLLRSPEIHRILERLVATQRPDVVLGYCSGMAAYAFNSPIAAFPFVLDMVDVDSCKWEALASTGAYPVRYVYGREARQLRRFEAAAAAKAVATTVVNARELEAMKGIAPSARVQVIENGIDLDSFRAAGPPATEPRVVFCGVFNYEPNETAACWLVQQVWPHVLKVRPDARLSLVGMNPTARVRALASDTVEVTGAVPDVRAYLWRSAAAVAPLQVARGLQNKVLEALAAGLPCVVTPAVFEGLPIDIARSHACAVAAEPAAFAHEIESILSLSAQERRRRAATVDLAPLSWEQQLAPMLPLLSEAAHRPANAGAGRFAPASAADR